MSVTLADDRTRFDESRKAMEAFDEIAAFVGLHDEERATVGAAHEFGAGVPKRQWLGPASDGATPKLASTLETEIGAVADGRGDAGGALEAGGKVLEDAARKYIEAGNVGGAALTERARRNDPRKLIDTGLMVDSISIKVGPDRESRD